jgi:hypothetical protein
MVEADTDIPKMDAKRKGTGEGREKRKKTVRDLSFYYYLICLLSSTVETPTQPHIYAIAFGFLEEVNR